MKKIIFLDFDGVLVTDRGQKYHLETNGTLRDDHGALFDPECVKCLKEIIDATDAEIVVTSTWKMEMGLDGIRQMWRDRDLPGNVIGVTPDIDPIHRGDEIAAWLNTCGDDCRYAIIDDTPFTDFFREEQLPHLFKVDERIGIDEETDINFEVVQRAEKKKFGLFGGSPAKVKVWLNATPADTAEEFLRNVLNAMSLSELTVN